MRKIKRKLHFATSYSKLIELSYKKEAHLLRDQALLNARGITTARIVAFAALREAFMNTIDSTTATANVTIIKETRDTSLQQLKTLIKEIWGIAAVALGVKTAEYKSFHSTNISQLNAKKVLALVSKTQVGCNQNFTQMQPKGLTTAMVNDLEMLRNTVSTNSNNTDVAKALRFGVTDDRITAANNLFDEMREMCNTAFVYFENRNKLIASQYIIYKIPGKHQQRNGSIAANKIIHRKLKGITAKSKFKLQVTSGSSITFYFSQTAEGKATTKRVVVAANDKNFVEATATNLGFNRSKGLIFFCIENLGEGAVESFYKVRVKG